MNRRQRRAERSARHRSGEKSARPRTSEQSISERTIQRVVEQVKLFLSALRGGEIDLSSVCLMAGPAPFTIPALCLAYFEVNDVGIGLYAAEGLAAILPPDDDLQAALRPTTDPGLRVVAFGPGGWFRNWTARWKRRASRPWTPADVAEWAGAAARVTSPGGTA